MTDSGEVTSRDNVVIPSSDSDDRVEDERAVAKTSRPVAEDKGRK